MNWQTPKIDWNPANVAASADFNRWEGNPRANRRRFEMSSRLGWGAGTVGAGVTIDLMRIGFTVQDDEKLVLKIARYSFETAGFQLRVRYNTTLKFTSASEEGEEEPDVTLLENTTGSPVSGTVRVEVYNNTGGSIALYNYDGFVLTLEKEDV